MVKQYDLAVRQPMQHKHDYADMPNDVILSSYVDNVVTYIAGFVIYKLLKKIKCEQCREALYVQQKPNFSRYDWVALKTRGRLIYASEDVVEICTIAEKCIQRLFIATGDRPSAAANIAPAVCCAVMDSAIERHVFASLDEHMFDNEADNNHVGHLVNVVTSEYVKCRLHWETRKYTGHVVGSRVRSQYSRLIIFNHQ